MAGNKTRGIIELPVGDATYTMQFNTNAMCALESRLADNQGIQEFLAELQAKAQAGKAKFSDIRLLMWAGLTIHHPDLTEADVGQIIDDLGGQQNALAKLGEGLGAASGGGGKGAGKAAAAAG